MIALLPYTGLALFDGWMHEKARRVPRFEQLLHASAAIALIVFLTGVFRGADLVAYVGLAVLLPVALVDEFGYHAPVARRERVVHAISYAALGGFVLAWRLLGATP